MLIVSLFTCNVNTIDYTYILSEVIKNRPLSAGEMVCIFSFAVFGYIWEIPVVFAVVETVSDNKEVRDSEK